jgi:hypothetical protein
MRGGLRRLLIEEVRQAQPVGSASIAAVSVH